MELRLHLARLSGELTRVTVELRGQIAELDGDPGQLAGEPGQVEPELHDPLLAVVAGASAEGVEASLEGRHALVEFAQPVDEVEQQLIGCADVLCSGRGFPTATGHGATVPSLDLGGGRIPVLWPGRRPHTRAVARSVPCGP